MKIGVFDSGVGGLTVFKAINRLLPLNDMIYFGDSVHLPYGNKSSKNIIKYSLENSEFLLNQGAELLVIACNTASAIARKTLVKKYRSFPITGVVIPGVEQALATLQNFDRLSINKQKNNSKKRICIAGTFRTIDSHIYRDEIRKRNSNSYIEIKEVACPSLVSLIEEGIKDEHLLASLLNYYLSPVVEQSDILVLGCTHYPLIKQQFKKNFPSVKLVDSAEATAIKVKVMIEEQEKSQKNRENSKNQRHRRTNKIGKIKIFTNDKNEVFTNISKKLFPEIKVKTV